MGIGRLIYSLKADDLELERRNISITPVGDIVQMSSVLNGLVIKNASEIEREALKILFTGRIGTKDYVTENRQYTVRVVKHCRFISLASHKVYLIDNSDENNKTAFKYGAFFYPTIRKAVNQYLYKPGEKNLLPIYKRMWFQIAVFLIIILFLFRGCQKNNVADTMISDIKRQQSANSHYTASIYNGTGYSMSLSNDWEQVNAADLGEGYDLAFANYVTLGSGADNSTVSVVVMEVFNTEGSSGETLLELCLTAIQTSDEFTGVTSPVTEESKDGYTSYCVEMVEPATDEVDYNFYRMDWMTPVGDNLYRFTFGSSDRSTYEKLKDDVKTSFSLTEYETPVS